MDTNLAASVSSADPVAVPDGEARPAGWRGFLVDWLRYTALGLDVSLISAAELAQYFEESGKPAGADRPH